MNVESYYRSYYQDAAFERLELFRLVQQRFAVRHVLYPGCAVHLAASWVFPHVLYVDRMPTAARFWQERAAIQQFIDRHKEYRGPAWFEFADQDYTQPLPAPHSAFELLISQFGGLISQPCKPYLRSGGLLLANDCHGDARAALTDADYRLIGTISCHRGQYRLEERTPAHAEALAASDAAPKRRQSELPHSYLFRRVA